MHEHNPGRSLVTSRSSPGLLEAPSGQNPFERVGHVAVSCWHWESDSAFLQSQDGSSGRPAFSWKASFCSSNWNLWTSESPGDFVILLFWLWKLSWAASYELVLSGSMSQSLGPPSVANWAEVVHCVSVPLASGKQITIKTSEIIWLSSSHMTGLGSWAWPEAD